MHTFCYSLHSYKGVEESTNECKKERMKLNHRGTTKDWVHSRAPMDAPKDIVVSVLLLLLLLLRMLVSTAATDDVASVWKPWRCLCCVNV